ncbi:pyridoxamine 5'-phosphate oxidase family protein [Rugamonas sp. FT107W]|uniref:Pyridoxamine 5'-phosphate oxidase family protein n=1 Tax=Duganella vulcania TaxID=2692166 RepID=A0A845HI94_9BURK|nr:pyridoxamine 5'-phosphate oxidase family protein [Duganella vulcania]MYN18408.1 pyridoxamine 5'-phosphate oxidase family protein [Duganella vulcania]
MQTLDPTHRQFVLDLLAATHDLTLATVRPDGYPQATVVSFVHDDLTLYAGIGLDSQKAHNIRQNDKVSATITPAYPDWRHIRGLSLAGSASIVAGEEETAHAADLMRYRFPQLRELVPPGDICWPGAVFVRIQPSVISILDYELGFGHTELFEVVMDI